MITHPLWPRSRPRTSDPLAAPAPLLAVVLIALASCVPATDEPPPASHPPALESFEVPSDGLPLAVWGRVPEAPSQVVLLLHGRTWSIRPDFDLRTAGQPSLMERLAGEGVAVYGLDARGYGDTPRDDTGWLNPDRMAQDARAALTWIRERHPGAAPPVVLGWSYGSAIAHLTAQRWPELVSGVALYGYFKDPTVRTPASSDPAAAPRAATTAEAARSDFITPGSIDASDVERFVEAALAADPVRVDIRRAEELNALSPDSLTVPTQILQGELDPIGRTVIQERLFRALGTAHKEWVVLPGCDHAAHLERCKARFEGAFLRFVREVG